MEHSCERVIIISQGKLVAIDSVANLTNRLRGSEAVAVEVEGAGGALDADEVQQRLEQVPGVSRVVHQGRQRRPRRSSKSRACRAATIRADLARAVVGAGWNLNELRAGGAEPGRHLPATDGVGTKDRPPPTRGRTMKNVWIICRKELKSYFASPIAYLLMAFFALIFGFVFYTATRDFVRFSFQAQMMGRGMPMNINEQIIRPLLVIRQHRRRCS